MSFLTVTDLKKHFPITKGVLVSKVVNTVKAVDGVSFSIEKGQILGLVGESGCGKSTLSRTLMQLITPTSGSVVLDGEELTTLPKEEIRRRRLDFQMIFQDPYASLNPRMTIFSTLAEAIKQRHPKLKGAALDTKIDELMRTVGLSPEVKSKYPHEFSGGQRQRIAIARALAPEPKLIIADEPVSALDVSIQSQILNLLIQLVKELGLTMIFISHDLSVVRYIADEMIVMLKGEIVERGDSEEVFSNPQHAYTQRLLDAVPTIATA